MTRLPRFALAIPADQTEPARACLAILAGFTKAGWRVQHFGTRARPLGQSIIDEVTGLPDRHLDSWLMPPLTCREVFAQGCRQADIALIEGTLDEVGDRWDQGNRHAPGLLRSIVEALDLPTIALVRCSHASGFHLPNVPSHVDAVLIDGLEKPDDYPTLKHLLELMLRKPVVGAVESLPGLFDPRNHRSGELSLDERDIEFLARSFLRFADLDAIRTLAESRPFPVLSDALTRTRGHRFRVAYAQDDAFGGYYPDTLETLETLGAELVEFSPLGDESLPPSVDLVILGCGHPDRYSEELAANLSLIAALKHHVCHGLRIYAEGGGTAYLGRSMILGNRRVPGAGILPFDACLHPDSQGPTPVSRVLTRDSWLGPSGALVQGYRSGRWSLRPAPEPTDCPARSGILTSESDIYFRHHAIGSLIHLHLAALPQVVEAFVGPHRPSLSIPTPRL